MKRFIVTLLVLTLTASICSAAPRAVQFKSKPNKIDVYIGDKLVTSYRYEETLPKPILYPVNTLSGIRLNRGHPFVKVEGESDDHPHHTGLFFTYDKINGTNFWNNASPPPQIKHIKVAGKKGD